jgi:hypothetical protein
MRSIASLAIGVGFGLALDFGLDLAIGLTESGRLLLAGRAAPRKPQSPLSARKGRFLGRWRHCN